jgi:DnaD/phage-associated family protein
MSTFMFNNKYSKNTPISNIFIDRYMPKARGEYLKVYLLGLKYCLSGELGASSHMIANTLGLLESDVINAWNYWNEQGVIKMTSIDSKGNNQIDFIDLNPLDNDNTENINLLEELSNTSLKDMLHDIEKLVSRPLSPKEMTMYLSWHKDFNFSPELILLLIQYCVSKGKIDSRYIEKIAISWHDSNIKNVNDAQSHIKQHEDKWLKIRKILNYLGIHNTDIMKPQEKLLSKWLDIYKYPLEVIYRACDICFERINKADFKYIDAILNSWYKDGLKSLEEIEKKGTKKSNYKYNSNKNKNKSNFTNYEQRDYNFNELEKKLLGWDNND